MNIKKQKIKVYDMTCTSCEARVEKAVKKLEGVQIANASFSSQLLYIEYDSDICSSEKIKEAINSAGYSTANSSSFKVIGIFIIVAAIILIGSSSSGVNINDRLKNATYFVLFIVGMLTSIHCLGMCGGIMLSQSINKENKSRLGAIKPTILYSAGRVISYTILGGIVGALGSVLSLSITTKAALQIFAGVFMIIMGLNMSGFSIFRKLNLKLPWSACSIKRKPKTPFFVGMLNGLMPCGPLQTMQLYALGTGSAFKGALSMFAFSLGTVPLMLTFGALSGLISKGYTKTLLKYSGILVVVLGIAMGTRGLALAGINIPTTNSIANSLAGNRALASSQVAKATIENGIQIIRMTADGSGYTPNGLYVQKNLPVKWIIDGKSINSCNGQIIVPSLKIQRNLKPGENIIQFTPKSSKDINFSCGMGMIRGVIKVVDNINSVNTSKPDSSIPQPSSGMSCCNGSGGTSASPSIPQKQSIYGNDLSQVSTDRLIHKAIVLEGNQAISIVGKGYEFEPIITVVEKGLNTTLSFDLKAFDNTEGNYVITSEAGETIASFQGKTNIIKVNANFNTLGLYLISKNGTILGAVLVQDDLKNVDLEKIRTDYIGN